MQNGSSLHQDDRKMKMDFNLKPNTHLSSRWKFLFYSNTIKYPPIGDYKGTNSRLMRYQLGMRLDQFLTIGRAYPCPMGSMYLFLTIEDKKPCLRKIILSGSMRSVACCSGKAKADSVLLFTLISILHTADCTYCT